MGGKQLGFSEYEQTTAKKQTTPEKFLSEREVVVPWQALIEVPTMRRFAGMDLITGLIPDETTILIFRHLLEKHKLGEQIFETVKAHLRERGLIRVSLKPFYYGFQA
jgi:IS5 family transposase